MVQLALAYRIIICLAFGAFTVLYGEQTDRRLEVEGCSLTLKNEQAVKSASAEARQLLSKWDDNTPIKDRLAVMVLFSRGLTRQDSNRLEWLRCALLKLQKHLQKTPMDVYIWTLNSTASPITVPSWLTPQAFPRVNIITIPEETWKVPCGLKPDSQWAARRHFEVDYYLMGRWRLAFSPDFAKEMGYEYHLQFDDDAILLKDYPVNIVEQMNEKHFEMAVNGDVLGEVAHLVIGLPELTYYWMRVNNFAPQGPLLKHVRGGDMWSFLNGGWDRAYHPGFFIIVSLTWWFKPEVQDYLNTVMRSGRDVEGRWQEQEVMNMMRLVFVPESSMWVMQDIDIGHDRHKRGNFEKWCAAG